MFTPVHRKDEKLSVSDKNKRYHTKHFLKARTKFSRLKSNTSRSWSWFTALSQCNNSYQTKEFYKKRLCGKSFLLRVALAKVERLAASFQIFASLGIFARALMIHPTSIIHKQKGTSTRTMHKRGEEASQMTLYRGNTLILWKDKKRIHEFVIELNDRHTRGQAATLKAN